MDVSFFGNLVELLNSGHGLVCAQAAEVDLDEEEGKLQGLEGNKWDISRRNLIFFGLFFYLYEFLGVEWSMEVLSHWDRFGNTNSSSVDSLPDISEVNSTSYFLD